MKSPLPSGACSGQHRECSSSFFFFSFHFSPLLYSSPTAAVLGQGCHIKPECSVKFVFQMNNEYFIMSISRYHAIFGGYLMLFIFCLKFQYNSVCCLYLFHPASRFLTRPGSGQRQRGEAVVGRKFSLDVWWIISFSLLP